MHKFIDNIVAFSLKNIKNLFFSEKATILSMNLCILFSDF